MSDNPVVDWLVDNAPKILIALGVIVILLDGPLPITDYVGISLITYGLSLGRVYKVVDAGVFLHDALDGSNPAGHDAAGEMIKAGQSTRLLPKRLGAPLSVAYQRTNYLRLKNSYCYKHGRFDLCN